MKYVKVVEVNSKYPSHIDIFRGVLIQKTKTEITICGVCNKEDDVNVYTVSLKNHKVSSLKKDEFQRKFEIVLCALKAKKAQCENELEKSMNDLKFAELKHKEYFR